MAQETHATTGAEGGHASGAFPPFARETFASQLLWFAIAFGLLYWLMAKVALPRVGEILEARTDRIAGDLADAERLRAEAEAAGEAYEKSLAEARAKSKAIAQETRDALLAESDARRKAIEADLAQKIADAEATISERTGAAMASVRSIAADAATAIVARLTGQAPERAEVERALDRTMAG
ncbi:MAG TPA: F0F1 ATP synthase subunit B [Beijerinckiaceae bacterium]